MKQLLLSVLATVVLAAAGTSCRTSDPAAAQAKKEKKEMEARQDSLDHILSFNALTQHHFVIEASHMQPKQGDMVLVTPTTNFVSMNGENVTIQVAPFNAGGPNGVGGITLNGRASNIRVNTDRHGNTVMTFNAVGAMLSSTVTINFPGKGIRTRVQISPNYHSNDVTLIGNLVPYDRRSIHKGSSI